MINEGYVDVWLLNRSPSTYQVSPDKLLETFDLRNDRLGLGDRIKRNPGFEVADDNPKLLILGKPGAGKTTFLRHLAVDWCKGQFQPDLIAVLIEFRQIRAEKLDLLAAIDLNLLAAIDKELGFENWPQLRELKERIENLIQEQKSKKSEKQRIRLQQQIDALQQQIETLQWELKSLRLKLLQQGKLLVLMDGLDELPTDILLQTVQRQIIQLEKDYPKNRFILTCRTQIIESIPIGFTPVEVSDFSEIQVEQFVQNWFKASGNSDAEAAERWKTLENAVRRNPALNELTVTPVLLSLMCWNLQDEGDIPSQVTWLYERGIKLLLSQWNDRKQITGWEVGSKTYRELSVERREALLTEIAARKFENPQNFVLFTQKEIAAHITEFLQLANPVEAVAVLKAIEAQHGLLVERAEQLWSFSHLTFQEYFTLQWLNQLPAEQLALKIANRQWQERVKQLVKFQQPADRLLRMIKQAVDQSISKEPILQKILLWVLQKSGSIQANYKPVAIRAFFFTLDRDRTLNLDLNCALDLAGHLALSLDFNLALDHALDLDLDRALVIDSNFDHTLALALNFDLDITLILTKHLALDLDLNHTFAHYHYRYLDRALGRALDRNLTFNSELGNKLKQLRTALPIFSRADREFQEWWQTNGAQWIKNLCQVMIRYCNIGHDWKLTPGQTQQLQRYYNANCFLVELMNIDGAVSNSVRAEIEDSLLLPWEEL